MVEVVEVVVVAAEYPALEKLGAQIQVELVLVLVVAEVIRWQDQMES